MTVSAVRTNGMLLGLDICLQHLDVLINLMPRRDVAISLGKIISEFSGLHNLISRGVTKAELGINDAVRSLYLASEMMRLVSECCNVDYVESEVWQALGIDIESEVRTPADFMTRIANRTASKLRFECEALESGSASVDEAG